MLGIYKKTLHIDYFSNIVTFSFEIMDKVESLLINEYGCIVCKAKMLEPLPETPMEIEGEVKDNILWASSIQKTTKNKAFLLSFLSSEEFQQVGSAMAEKILHVTGNDIYTFAEREDAVLLLSKEKGISTKFAEDFITKLRKISVNEKIYLHFSELGLSYASITVLIQEYGQSAIEKIKKHPYIIGQKAEIPFLLCEKIAKESGFTGEEEERIRSLVYESFHVLKNSGNTSVTLADLHRIVILYSRNNFFQEYISKPQILNTLLGMKDIVCLKKKEESGSVVFMLQKDYEISFGIREHMMRLNVKNPRIPVTEEIIQQVQQVTGIVYGEDQKKAFQLLNTTGIKFIDGGPGTGKTTFVNGLLKVYHMLYPDNSCILCAPTGRAASRLKETTGETALTIHKTIDFKPYDNSELLSCKNLDDPIDADLIIVDESSMADEEIIRYLLGAIQNDTIVLFMGDTGQLPSVGVGSFLRDCLASQLFETYHFTQVFRQKNTEKNSLIENAWKIRRGQHDLILDKNSIFVEVSESNQIEPMIQKILEKENIKDLSSFQVLTTTKLSKREGSTVKLNRYLQEYFNKGNSILTYSGADNCGYKIGDKVMTLSNNYARNYTNGDVGIITDITSKEICIDFGDGSEPRNVPTKELYDLTLAYAVTIHKSQGSESNIVIIVLPKDPKSLLNRNLLYTAFTRSKEKVYVLGEKGTIHYAIDNVKVVHRNTVLKQMLASEVQVVAR